MSTPWMKAIWFNEDYPDMRTQLMLVLQYAINNGRVPSRDGQVMTRRHRNPHFPKPTLTLHSINVNVYQGHFTASLTMRVATICVYK